MTESIKNFLETNYMLLDTDINEFFHSAYNGLSKNAQVELINVLQQANIDYETSRESVLRFILTMELEDLTYPIPLKTFAIRKSWTLGYTAEELYNILLSNANEWDSVKLVEYSDGNYKIIPNDYKG